MKIMSHDFHEKTRYLTVQVLMIKNSFVEIERELSGDELLFYNGFIRSS